MGQETKIGKAASGLGVDGPIRNIDTEQRLTTTPAAIALTSSHVTFDLNAVGAYTLADGVDGQRMRFRMVFDGGDCVVTPANLAGGTTITFNDVGDYAELEFYVDPTGGSTDSWYVVSLQGAVLA